MVYDIKSGNLKCPNCTSEIDIVSDRAIEEHPYSDRDSGNTKTDQLAENNQEITTMSCESCGAVIELSPEITATSCPYCDSHIVLAQKQEATIVPDGISPFKIDKIEAGQKFNEWIKKKWLAPSDLKNLYQKDKFLQIYVPFWTFDAEVESFYRGSGGIDRTVEYKDDNGETKTRTETDWYNTSGTVRNSFDDILIRATRTLDEKCLKNIGSYDTIKGLKGYSPEYMSGFSAERHTIPLKDAHDEAVIEMENDMKELARKDILKSYDRAKVDSVNSRMYDETYKHVILPIYSTSYAFKGKTYNVLINGETGYISGSYPKSYLKIGIIVAIVLIILIFIFTRSKASAEILSYYNYIENIFL
ncbi:MAG: hypothetical protein Q4P31_07485 [Andreesenia angusta]|nr:hypothetical protein [Andreesenia angusta]